MIVVMGSYLTALVMETDRVPTVGETVTGRNFRVTHGGKGSNQAVQAARLGGKVRFLGVVGEDNFGDGFLALCAAEGVDASGVKRSSSRPTGAGFIICGGGHNLIAIDIGALHEFDAGYIAERKGAISPGDIVLIQQEVPLDSALLAAAAAREAGATVILNPAPAFDVTGRDLSCVDIYTPNETEARVCLGLAPRDPRPDAEIARLLLGLGCRAVAMTLGERGCLVADGGGCDLLPPLRIPRAVDSTGAGDSFNGALAVALSEGKDLRGAAAFANVAAGLSCTKADTIPSYHRREEVEAAARLAFPSA